MIKVILRIGVFSMFFINYSFAQDGSQIQKNSESIIQSETEVAKEPQKKYIVLSQAPQIASSINPIYQIAKFISGDDKSNFLLISPKFSEHDYQFKVSNINTLNKADVVFYVGDGLENYLVKALDSLKKQPEIVNMSQSKYVKLLSFQSRVNENDIDYHIWLSPANAIGIAKEIAETLSAIYPPSASIYKKNLQLFILDIQKMDEANKMKLSKIKTNSFVVDHDSTAYFENYYNLRSAGVMRYYHDQELTSRDIGRIDGLIKGNQISCILGSAQERSGLSVQIAANNKAKLVLIDIMGDEDNGKQNGYTKMMSNLVDNLVKCTNK